jgi:bifunctional DNA-binding transcriptional regulator/antitoxin component of YhaV-PrlF toxin-antitoxin module
MKLKNKNIRKLLKIGKTSLATTLPKEMTDALGWREKQKVVVKRTRGGLIIKDWRSPSTRPSKPRRSWKPKAKLEAKGEVGKK